MKTLIALAALALSAPALADNPHNNPPAEQQPQQTFTFEGGTEASSASGFQTEFSTENGGVVGFLSVGVAGSFAEATPFTASSTSFHGGAFVGATFGNADLTGSATSFGQSEAFSTFEFEAEGFED